MMWQRHLFLVAALIGLASLQLCAQIVDCVYPGHVSVSRIQGQVFDPLGGIVPGAAVSVAADNGSTMQTATDSQGRFRLQALSGKYAFKTVFPMLQASQTELIVDKDLASLAHSSNLYVVLGMAGSFCAWVTTSQREFRDIISSNQKRMKESTRNNATKK